MAYTVIMQRIQDSLDLTKLREQLRKMSDPELRKFGQAATDRCSTDLNRGKPPQDALIQLDEAQAEWRRRQDAKSKRRREVPRYTFIAVTEILDNTGQACVLAKTSKISRKGCYVDTPTPLAVGTSFGMVISRDQGTFATKGKVLYIHEGQGMGVAFADVTADQLKTLHSWLPDGAETITAPPTI